MKNSLLITALFFASTCFARENTDSLKLIAENRHNDQVLHELIPIVKGSFQPSQYEKILMTQLRDASTSTTHFRVLTQHVGSLLVNKVVECLPLKQIQIRTPVAPCAGSELGCNVELVSVMRSGDALLETFIKNFPGSNVSKILVQRDEVTALPHFKYMKLSPTIASGNYVIITEPMIATGGSLDTVITLLKEKGVQEGKIIIAAVCVAPEGLLRLSESYPQIKVVMTALDEKLNEKSYIVPGLGDFGDRYFGTCHQE